MKTEVSAAEEPKKENTKKAAPAKKTTTKKTASAKKKEVERMEEIYYKGSSGQSKTGLCCRRTQRIFYQIYSFISQAGRRHGVLCNQ